MRTRFLTGTAIVVTCFLGTMTSAALADMRADTSDRVHADSFGNLVIHSSAGYKRILVGQGHAAEAYNLTGSYYEPEIARVDPSEPLILRRATGCEYDVVILHGRSYMYGLPDGVVPTPAYDRCR